MDQFIISNYHKPQDIDLAFFKETTRLINTYPFKWSLFIDYFFKNGSTFIKDSTMILSLLSFSLYDIELIFYFMDRYLKIKVINKIIYKKEFIIFNFNSEYLISFFKDINKWMIIPYIYNTNKLYDVKLDAEIDGEKYDLFFKAKHYYLIDTKKNNIDNRNINLFQVIFIKNVEDENIIQFAFGEEMQKYEILKITSY